MFGRLTSCLSMAKLRSIVFLFFSCFCMHSLSSSHAQTHNATLMQGQQLSDQDGDFLVSENGLFKLGFFSPGNSSIFGAATDRYLGVWYYKLPNDPDAVWVANPETPIIDTSGVFVLASDATLKLIHGGGQVSVSDPNKTVSGNVTLSLLGTGNLVLRELATNGTTGNVLWESFDHLTNTLLPGMKLGMNIKAGQNWTISSWFSDQLPAPGAFRLGIDPGSTNQLIIWRRDEVYWSSGVWENGSFQNAPEMTRRVDLFEFTFVSNKEDKYFSYTAKNSSIISRWELNAWGQIMQYILTVNDTTWERTLATPCMLNLNNPGALCIEEKPSACRNGSYGLVPVRGYFDGTEILNHDNNTNLTVSDCHATCWSDCSCIGYKSIYSNGTGCVFMSGAARFVANDYFDATYVLNLFNNSKEGSKMSHVRQDMKKKWWLWCIIGLIFVMALLACYLCFMKKRKLRLMKHTGQEHGLEELRSQFSRFDHIYKLKIGERIGQNFRMFSFSEIVAATANFSSACKLGQGGFGPVYKGVLPDGEQVGVKRLARSSGQGLEEFMNEITLIAELQHSNLVRLLGCCIQGEEKILIYEFMANKSLDAFLFDSTRSKQLDWQRRVSIIEGIAQGLLYLHKYSRVRVIHRDLKASNILLDENMNPKISDFGMARIFGQNESMANTVRVVGTYGYMSPEYAMMGFFSEKSDVYSFGVLLLEIISGKKNTAFLSSTGLCLIELAWELWKQGHTLEIKDTSLDSGSKDEVLKFIQVGLLCVQEHAEDRANMSEVIPMLTSDVAHLPDPKQPAYTISRSEAGSTSRSLNNASVNYDSMTVMDGRFQGISWNSDETLIAYVAEEPSPSKPTFTWQGYKKGSTTDENFTNWKGQGEWGETYVRKGQPAYFVIDINSGETQAVRGIEKHLSVGQVVWEPSVRGLHHYLVFVGWSSDTRKLGIQYCYNWPCALYAVKLPADGQEINFRDNIIEDSAVVKLTQTISSAYNPRFSPDGKLLLFLSSRSAVESGAHSATDSLDRMDWLIDGVPCSSAKTFDVIHVVMSADDGCFPGLYCSSFLSNPWFSDGCTAVISSFWGSCQVVISVNVLSGEVLRMSLTNSNFSWNALSLDGDNIIAGDIKTLFMHLSRQTILYNYNKISTSCWINECSEKFSIMKIPARDVSDSLTKGARNPFQAIFVSSKTNRSDSFDPLIVFLHGGPHTVSSSSFSKSLAFLSAIGFNLLLVNYRSNVDLDNLQYARALKENRVAVKIIVFLNDNHPIDRPQSD